MFLFRRGDEFIANTGQTFRNFLANGFEGHRATFADWALHVNTLFPEARLKRTIEARACDCVPLGLLGAVPAVFTGLLYDPQSLGRAMDLAQRLNLDDVIRARPQMVAEGLRASVGGVPVRRLAEEVLEIAGAGLSRRARLDAAGKDEGVYLAPLAELVARGQCPADRLVEGLAVGEPVSTAEIVRRTRF
jgi:glutamate--cysteine ligase